MKVRLLMVAALSSIAVLAQQHRNSGFEEPKFTGYFEGTEPFWNMEINDNQITLHCINDIVADTLRLSKKQTHTDTWAFQGRYVFGIVRESASGCQLDITEEDNPTHEIYFHYAGATYMGCGKLYPPDTRPLANSLRDK
ncbi:MAG TPA: hypothetical protein VNQ55_00800 [Parapedobacter sp.]|nr:hypothetical protein [Parapedobacter sp.]